MEAHHQALMAALATAGQPSRTTTSSYVVGRALSSFPLFTGEDAADCCAYLGSFERLANAHQIPVTYWFNELYIKLAGLAKGWYEQNFPDPDKAEARHSFNTTSVRE